MAFRMFDQYNGKLMRLDSSVITGANVVTSVIQCEQICLSSETSCGGANVVPIRAGVYSCELIQGFPLLTSLDLQEGKSGIFLHRKGKTLDFRSVS